MVAIRDLFRSTAGPSSRVLRPRLNPWSARRREDLAEEDLASPLYVPGRRQILDADDVILPHRTLVLADWLTRRRRLALLCHGMIGIVAP